MSKFWRKILSKANFTPSPLGRKGKKLYSGMNVTVQSL